MDSLSCHDIPHQENHLVEEWRELIHSTTVLLFVRKDMAIQIQHPLCRLVSDHRAGLSATKKKKSYFGLM